MARVVVVGGGLSGMASAVRLAKLGHAVTLAERLPRLGGALGYVHKDGFRWDAGPATTTLPAVLRDLFRKSGRPLERELDLVELPVVREHRFADGSRVTLPGATRSGQREAVDAGLGPGLGERWLDWTDRFAPAWELLRKDYLERAYDPAYAASELAALLRDRTSLRRSARGLKDDRLRAMAVHHAVAGGHRPRDVPWWAAIPHHLEQTFGVWSTPDGLALFATLLTKRLGERSVTVMTETEVLDLLPGGGGVRTSVGDIEADHVVVAVDPRSLPALAAFVRRTTPALPPAVCHIGLSGTVPDLPHEVVLHGDPAVTILTSGAAPPGGAAWTVSAYGLGTDDLLPALARHGIDVRRNVEVRIDRSPAQQVEQLRGSAYGVLWQGRRTLERQLATRTPITNVYAVGAHTTISALTPFVGLTAALAAELIGPASASRSR